MDSPQSPSLVRRLRQRHHWLDHLARAAARYARNHGDHYAAAITYFSVLALVPLLLIGFSALGFVLLAQPDLVDDVRDVITGTVPAGLDEVLVPLVDTAVQQRTAVGVIGLLGAAYTGLGWIGNLREALTAQWEQRRRPGPFLRTRVFDVLALFGLGIALLLSLGLTAAGTAFATDLLELVGLADVRWARALLVVATVLLALAGNWLVFVWVVARLPREPVTLPSAARAALLGAVGFQILTLVATLLLRSLSGAAGAALGPVVGLLVFAYLVSRLVLFVTAWAATSAGNERPATEPEVGAVIRPAITVHRGPDGRTVTTLLGVGALVGLGVGWLARRR